MKILYFGSYCDEQLYAKRVAQQVPFFVAQFSYEQALCEEFVRAGDMDIEFITIYQTGYYPKDKLLWRVKRHPGSRFRVLGFLNLPFFREASYFFSALFQLSRWAIKNRREREKCVYMSTHFTPVSAAVVLFTKLFRIKRIVTFTDLSLFTFQQSRIRQMPAYKRLIIRPYVALTDWLQESYDGYVLFSAQMNAVVNPKHKPYCVVEGIYNRGDLDLGQVQKENALAHAGTLSSLVGIGNILEAHGRISLPTELWLMGDGDMREEILSRSKSDPRVKYLGFMPRRDVFEKLKAARLLLILRNSSDEYTRYSFPSKLFEYMASGTPVFMTRLEGIPEEYYDYVYSTNSQDIAEIAAMIEETLKKTDRELEKKGMAARQFILTQKNAENQSAKIRVFLLNMNCSAKG